MPKFMDVDDKQLVDSYQGFEFTKINVDKLGATEYTAVTIIVDKTFSVRPFKKDLEDMIKAVVDSCKKSPRALNLLIRIIAFNNMNIEEIHGWMLLHTINTDDYTDTIFPDGCTNLYDATLKGLKVLHLYLADLYKTEKICNANGIVFIITDGDDNASKVTPSDIKKVLAEISQEEVIESLRTILIGVNDSDKRFQGRLKTYKQESGLDEYVSIGEATPGKLAKLAEFVSQSISSQSSSLGTGQPSQLINYKF